MNSKLEKNTSSKVATKTSNFPITSEKDTSEFVLNTLKELTALLENPNELNNKVASLTKENEALKKINLALKKQLSESQKNFTTEVKSIPKFSIKRKIDETSVKPVNKKPMLSGQQNDSPENSIEEIDEFNSFLTQ